MPELERRFECAEDLLHIANVSRESLPRLEAYVDLLVRWQSRINLIGPATVGDIWHRHMADSLQLLEHVPQDAETVLDLGSGAGLPGVVLALARPAGYGFTVHLIESNAKKCAFLSEVIRQTGAPAKVHNARIESLDSDALQAGKSVVTARALAPLCELLDYARKPLENGAIGLFLKGRDIDRELTEAAKYWKVAAHRIESLTQREACILKIEEASRVA